MLIDAAERGWVPDLGIRVGIRQLLKKRLNEETSIETYQSLIDQLKSSDAAIETQAANDQHYEVPADFFRLALGPHLKYSSCYWPEGVTTLADAEAAMLKLYAKRAQLQDGQRVLDLGCGWGSFSLWAAQQYPASQFVAVSNSHSQKQFIDARAKQLGLDNLEVRTADINALTIAEQFDRIVSVEMLEHVRNYQMVFENLAKWLRPDGEVFIHIFCNRSLLYPFEDKGQDDWMARHFFTGGLMPAADTLLHFQDHLKLDQRWQMSGEHYQKTARAWLENTDAKREEITTVLAQTYSAASAPVWVQRWRMFFMACEELFGYDSGKEWLVCHYRFVRR